VSVEFESFKREPPTLNLSALIDIVFILVIFIVLAANFQRIQNVDVSLPEADDTAPSDPKALIVTVPIDGPIKVGDETIELALAGARLRALKGEYDTVLLVADRQASIQRAVQLLGDARKAGFKSVGIASQEPGGTP
jgi:biopolymer transport protein ExbD